MYFSEMSSLFLCFLCLASPALSFGRSSESPPGINAILLSRVQSLTLRANRLTSARRVSPIQQLQCIGPSKRVCDLYKIDTMRCTNAGYDYDKEDVQWTCTAQIPPEFKLGSTDVVCEGYRNADDKWVLKGSCGVEYRLLLTERGEKKFGVQEDMRSGVNSTKGESSNRNILGDIIVFGFIAAVLFLILWPVIRGCLGLRDQRHPNANRDGSGPGRPGGPEGPGGPGGPGAPGAPEGPGGPGGGGGGGGGGAGGHDNYPGPPPPYSSCSGSSSFPAQASAPEWRPGFWTGAAGGGAAGYEIGRRSDRWDSPSACRPSSSRRDYQSDRDEGSSRSRSPPQVLTTTTSTGFGSTRRR